MKELLLCLSVTISSLLAFGDNFSVDVKQSKIEWTGTKIAGSHHGTIDFKSGEFKFEKDKLVAGEFVADMNSLKNLDMTMESMNQKLVGHLKSEDFFSVVKFPESKFVIKSVNHKTNNELEIKGDMTIKGITKEITFPAKFKRDQKTIEGNADVKLDRSKWDVRYGSKTFFANIGDKIIHDEFTLKIAIKANQK